MRVPDLAMAGVFSSEGGIYKALVMGTPYFKAVCMDRTVMIPGMVGKNIGKWREEDKLPKTVSEFGHRPQEIFVHYEELEERYGGDMKNMPLDALGIYSYAEKTKVGLQQLMAGVRRFNLSTLCRNDLMTLTEDAAKISGIDYVMDAYRNVAESILDE